MKLILNDKKKPKACLANTLTALRHAPGLKGSFRYNEFAYRIEVAQPLPWDENQDEWIARIWTDDDDVRLAKWLQRQGIMVKLGEVGPAVGSVARKRRYHPLRDYLDGLHWDCYERLESELPTLFGVVPTAYTSAVFRWAMIGAVARAYEPGCKHDTVLMLEGNQGKKKWSSLECLFGKRMFTDDLAEDGLDTVDSVETAPILRLPTVDTTRQPENGRATRCKRCETSHPIRN